MCCRFLFLILLFLSLSSNAEESLLTLKQQLDRLQREVSDLSSVVYKKSTLNNVDDIDSDSENNNISAFDMRIYDLEKDIKSLILNFEELTFEIDELKNAFEDLNVKLNTAMINEKDNLSKKNSKAILENEVDSNNKNQENKNIKENSLGTLNLNSQEYSEDSEKLELPNNQENNINDLKPDEQFQLAFDLIRARKYNEAKIALNNFINNNPDNTLSGSAHFRLGQIHMLQKEYGEAAIVFAEGYQKFPNSIKSPDNLYGFAEALIKLEKIEQACDTLNQFLDKYSKHKLLEKTNRDILTNCS